MLDLKVIGETICYYRESINLTQQDLADCLYVSRQAVSKWETGKSIPSIEIMVELTKIYHISIDDLIWGHKTLNHDATYLLANYPRSYVLHQLISGKLENIKLHEMLYLLNKEERDIVISHIIKQNIQMDLTVLFPCLNMNERRRLVIALSDKLLIHNDKELIVMLTTSEKKLLEGKNEY